MQWVRGEIFYTSIFIQEFYFLQNFLKHGSLWLNGNLEGKAYAFQQGCRRKIFQRGRGNEKKDRKLAKNTEK